jgi:hypothetical protein
MYSITMCDHTGTDILHSPEMARLARSTALTPIKDRSKRARSDSDLLERTVSRIN